MAHMSTGTSLVYPGRNVTKPLLMYWLLTSCTMIQLRMLVHYREGNTVQPRCVRMRKPSVQKLGIGGRVSAYSIIVY